MSKQLQNNFTSIEQSKKLLELGVPADSADETYQRYYEKNSYDNALVRKAETFNGIVNDFHIPCWSVGRLIEIYVALTSREYVSLIFKKTFTPMAKILDKFEKDTKNGMLDFSKLED